MKDILKLHVISQMIVDSLLIRVVIMPFMEKARRSFNHVPGTPDGSLVYDLRYSLTFLPHRTAPL